MVSPIFISIALNSIIYIHCDRYNISPISLFNYSLAILKFYNSQTVIKNYFSDSQTFAKILLQTIKTSSKFLL